MTDREELRQLVMEGDPSQFETLADMIGRVIAGESMESIAASYGVSLEGIEE